MILRGARKPPFQKTGVLQQMCHGAVTLVTLTKRGMVWSSITHMRSMVLEYESQQNCPCPSYHQVL